MAEMTDREFEELFSALDDVVASDELRASTLAAIFGDAEGYGGQEEAAAQATAVINRAPVAAKPAEVDKTLVATPPLRLVDDEPAAEASVAVQADPHVPSRRKRGWGFSLRVAAALLVVAIGLGGGLAYALPASHVLVSVGDTTFDLGVNVFGITVSATADNDDGKKVIENAQLHHIGFEDTLNKLLVAYEVAHPAEGEQPTFGVRVEGGFGDGPQVLSGEAQRVIGNFERERAQQPSAQGQPEAQQPEQQAQPQPGGATLPEGQSQQAQQPQFQEQPQPAQDPQAAPGSQQAQQPEQQAQPQQQPVEQPSQQGQQQTQPSEQPQQQGQQAQPQQNAQQQPAQQDQGQQGVQQPQQGAQQGQGQQAQPQQDTQPRQEGQQVPPQ